MPPTIEEGISAEAQAAQKIQLTKSNEVSRTVSVRFQPQINSTERAITLNPA